MTSLGQIVDQRGITTGLEDEDFVSDIVVVVEVIEANGDKTIRVLKDEHTNWLKEAGMIAVASQIVLSGNE